MRTVLFALFILLTVGGGLWYRFWRDDSPMVLKNKQTIAPIVEWGNILPGTWELRWEYQNHELGWLEQSNIDYFADGTFKKHFTFSRYQWLTSNYTNASKLDIFKYGDKFASYGGMILGKWKINLDKGNWEEIITSCTLPWIEESPFHKEPLGSYEDNNIMTHFESFTQDSIKIIGKDYSTDAKISFLFTRLN